MTVTVYGKDFCKQCTATTRKLDNKKIDYLYVDIEKDEAAMAKVKELGLLAAPVVVVEGVEPWGGYRPDLIDLHL